MGRRRMWVVGIPLVGTAIAVLFGLEMADRSYPPPLERAAMSSVELLDADGHLLRAFATPDERWRLRTTQEDVDPRLIDMLIAYEDQRFRQHGGVDTLALMRAAGQLVANLQIISGGSTLTMQVARLLEPERPRSFLTKAIQIARAIQIERRLDKDQILDLYLTLAPFGGNLEGVRAASLAYFGKEPKRLSVEEAALLVALPQSPEMRRPDRHSDRASFARGRVLERLASLGLVDHAEGVRASATPVPTGRLQLPSLAAHLAQAARRSAPDTAVHHSTLKRGVQEALELVARETIAGLDPKVSMAMMMADAQTGEVVAEVGSADYFDSSRSGWIDMTRVQRSPGSTLKPFIYGLAFEAGLVAQETIIEDRPADFFGYRPRNFDMQYQGDVSVRQALQLSLNVPAVRLLDRVGATRLVSRLRQSGVALTLPKGEAPGLAIALGGAGIDLASLVQAYAALARNGLSIHLADGIRGTASEGDGVPLMDENAAWTVSDVLAGVTAPSTSRPLGIAYKTGTSYGYRDAWSVGYNGRYVLGVWVGRPDNAAVPGISGYATAAPILFKAFERSGLSGVPLATRPSAARRIPLAELPQSLKRFSLDADGLTSVSTREKPPQIIYPPEGAQIELGASADGTPVPLALKLQAGRPPFRWLANGKPLDRSVRTRTSQWLPEGAGYSTLTVIDAAGRAASVGVFLH